jgi:protein TonB
MFEAVNPPARSRREQFVTLAVSIVAHVAVVGVLLILPLLYFADQLPKPPDMMAFVVEAAPPPPPPPPPPAVAPQKPQPVKQNVPQAPTQPVVANPAPVEAPSQITAPAALPDVPVRELAGLEGGVAGGIAGGVAGGVPLMPAPPPPPPPPPAPPAPAKPVRIGGAIAEPKLVHRVQPVYPQIAINARKEGVVVLEATVGADGAVRQVRVLRSEPLLDQAAAEAVKQWRYAPLQLNGQAHPFILTVTVSFSL